MRPLWQGEDRSFPAPTPAYLPGICGWSSVFLTPSESWDCPVLTYTPGKSQFMSLFFSFLCSSIVLRQGPKTLPS